MGLTVSPAAGQTPISEEEREGLKIKSVLTRRELDELEQQNIEQTLMWLMRKKIGADRVLTEDFIRSLHIRMFGSVWNWAGKFRLSNKNIGVDKSQIAVELKKLLADCRYWLEHKTFSEEEIALRLKHRLVLIHPFPNGNGRLSRLLADVMMEKVFNKPAFSWGGLGFSADSGERKRYILSLQAADQGDYHPLRDFAQSV